MDSATSFYAGEVRPLAGLHLLQKQLRAYYDPHSTQSTRLAALDVLRTFEMAEDSWDVLMAGVFSCEDPVVALGASQILAAKVDLAVSQGQRPDGAAEAYEAARASITDARVSHIVRSNLCRVMAALATSHEDRAAEDGAFSPGYFGRSPFESRCWVELMNAVWLRVSGHHVGVAPMDRLRAKAWLKRYEVAVRVIRGLLGCYADDSLAPLDVPSASPLTPAEVTANWIRLDLITEPASLAPLAQGLIAMLARGQGAAEDVVALLQAFCEAPVLRGTPLLGEMVLAVAAHATPRLPSAATTAFFAATATETARRLGDPDAAGAIDQHMLLALRHPNDGAMIDGATTYFADTLWELEQSQTGLRHPRITPALVDALAAGVLYAMLQMQDPEADTASPVFSDDPLGRLLLALARISVELVARRALATIQEVSGAHAGALLRAVGALGGAASQAAASEMSPDSAETAMTPAFVRHEIHPVMTAIFRAEHPDFDRPDVFAACCAVVRAPWSARVFVPSERDALAGSALARATRDLRLAPDALDVVAALGGPCHVSGAAALIAAYLHAGAPARSASRAVGSFAAFLIAQEVDPVAHLPPGFLDPPISDQDAALRIQVAEALVRRAGPPHCRILAYAWAIVDLCAVPMLLGPPHKSPAIARRLGSLLAAFWNAVAGAAACIEPPLSTAYFMRSVELTVHLARVYALGGDSRAAQDDRGACSPMLAFVAIVRACRLRILANDPESPESVLAAALSDIALAFAAIGDPDLREDALGCLYTALPLVLRTWPEVFLRVPQAAAIAEGALGLLLQPPAVAAIATRFFRAIADIAPGPDVAASAFQRQCMWAAMQFALQNVLAGNACRSSIPVVAKLLLFYLKRWPADVPFAAVGDGSSRRRILQLLREPRRTTLDDLKEAMHQCYVQATRVAIADKPW